jgi:hypothetical protein
MIARKTTSLVRVAASTLLAAAAAGPTAAQSIPKQAAPAGSAREARATGEVGAAAPAPYPMYRSVFDTDGNSPVTPVAVDATPRLESLPPKVMTAKPSGQVEAPPRSESLPPPRAAAESPPAPKASAPNGAACSSPQQGYGLRGKLGSPACWGFPSEFEPVPFGQSVNACIRQHVGNGEAARMVLYQYDFVDGAPALNLHGMDQLAKIAALLGHNGFPIIIERTPCNPALAEARRLTVLLELGHGPAPVPPDRIVIGPPIASGLRGAEAEVIYQNLITQTRERGLVSGAGTGLIGAGTSQQAGGGGGGGGGGMGAGAGGGGGSPR